MLRSRWIPALSLTAHIHLQMTMRTSSGHTCCHRATASCPIWDYTSAAAFTISKMTKLSRNSSRDVPTHLQHWSATWRAKGVPRSTHLFCMTHPHHKLHLLKFAIQTWLCNCPQYLCLFHIVVECIPSLHDPRKMLVLPNRPLLSSFHIGFLSSQFYVIHIHR